MKLGPYCESCLRGAEPLLDDLISSSVGAQFGMVSWERLPENEYDALVHAVQEGPVGISVAASDWLSCLIASNANLLEEVGCSILILVAQV